MRLMGRVTGTAGSNNRSGRPSVGKLRTDIYNERFRTNGIIFRHVLKSQNSQITCYF